MEKGRFPIKVVAAAVKVVVEEEKVKVKVVVVNFLDHVNFLDQFRVASERAEFLESSVHLPRKGSNHNEKCW